MGIVMNHVKTIFPATSHLTSRNRLEAPTPKIPEVTTWVVLTGKAGNGGTEDDGGGGEVGGNSVGGLDLEDFEPMVLMIFQPPKEVPSPIAAAAETLTHSGTSRSD